MLYPALSLRLEMFSPDLSMRNSSVFLKELVDLYLIENTSPINVVFLSLYQLPENSGPTFQTSSTKESFLLLSPLLLDLFSYPYFSLLHFSHVF